jgi:hypothetical protein
MTKETCHLCLKQLSEDEIDLCDDCFENMEMEVWVESKKCAHCSAKLIGHEGNFCDDCFRKMFPRSTGNIDWRVFKQND